jgi:Tol biopolymer transport system component
MSDVNSPMNDVEPSFSADLCDLYFASDRDGKYALYRAHRR